MIFLRLLTWPYVRKHKLRSLLTLIGITLGVAVFVGMHTANLTVTRAFAQTVDRIAGKAQLQVSAGETGFPEEALEKAQALTEVAAAAPVIEAVLNTGFKGQGNLLVLGVDMTGDRSLREYDLEDDDVIDDPLIFLAQPDSIILSRQFALANAITRNQRITLQTMNGPRQFTVRGVMKAGGLASAFGGNLAIMDIYAAQMVFGRGRLFDRLDIGVATQSTVEAAQAKLAAVLGPGYQVEAPSARAQHFDAISRGLAITINISSMFALLIGVFIIYNSFAIAITQRRAEIGILRALGSSRGQILYMFLAESALAGLIGSLAGAGLGLLIARSAAPLISGLVRDVYGTPQVVSGIAVNWPLLSLAVGIGVAVSLLGGFLPARAAAIVDPVKALQKGRYQILSEGENRIRFWISVALGAGAALCLVASRGGWVFYAGFALTIAAVLLLSPALSLLLARLLRPLLRLIRPVEGALAADSLIQSPRRTSATVSALMLSLALAVGFSGVANAIYGSVVRWMDGALNPDLFITPTESLTLRQYRFPAEFEAQLAAFPGIDEVQGVRNARVMIQGGPAMAVAVDLGRVWRRVNPIILEGEREQMMRELKAGRGVILSQNLSNLRNLHLGDPLELSTPSGTLSLKVLGVILDFSDQQGSFFIDHGLFIRQWQDATINIFRVYLKPGTDPDAFKRLVLDRFSGERRLFVFTNAALRKYILDTTAQWFGMTYIQLAVALMVAVLGIVNTLTVSITDRRRELGVLQAVGGLRNQIRGTVWLEALAIGMVGLVLGLGLGAVTLLYNIELLRREVAGLHLEYLYPVQFAAFLLPVVLAAAWIASLWPAETAVRASLVESLEYE